MDSTATHNIGVYLAICLTLAGGFALLELWAASTSENVIYRPAPTPAQPLRSAQPIRSTPPPQTAAPALVAQPAAQPAPEPPAVAIEPSSPLPTQTQTAPSEAA